MYMSHEFTTGKKLSWFFITVSNILWLLVFIPQLYQNYKRKNSDGFSLLLLLFLLVGDILSITSAYAKNLTHVIIYAAAYHIILDLIIIGQILYYRQRSGLFIQYVITESSNLLDTYEDSSHIYPYFCLSLSEVIFVTTSTFVITAIQLFMLFVKEYNDIIADLIAWLALFIFMSSRIPQITLNFSRKSISGLSLLSFIIINIANFFFLLSVLIILYDLESNTYIDYIIANIQWIVGSSSTTLFDCVIFYQFYKYK